MSDPKQPVDDTPRTDTGKGIMAHQRPLAQIVIHTLAGATAMLDTSKRCDHGRCDAQAFIQTYSHQDQDLWFCGHHYELHEITLGATVRLINDFRILLAEDRLVGSSH
jgi:hypothetical protein